MNASRLESIQLELLLSTADFVGEASRRSLLKAFDAIGGTLLFNLRVEHDVRFQRCAAVVVGDEPDHTIALVFLNRDGRSAPCKQLSPVTISEGLRWNWPEIGNLIAVSWGGPKIAVSD